MRRSLPRISATISGPPPMPSVTVPTPGIGNRDQAEQDAHHHAEAERHVAEFRRGLHGVAEMLPDLLLAVGRHQHADAIAELQHQVGRRHDVHVVAADMQEMRRKAGRHRQLRKRNADHVGLADEDADVVERGAILDDPPGLEAARACAAASAIASCSFGDDQQAVAGASTMSADGHDVLAALADHRHLHAARQVLAEIVERAARAIVSPSVISPMWKRCALGGNFGLHVPRHEIDAQDRADHAERIGDRIADRRLAVLHDVERRLQRRGAGHRAGEDAERVADLDAEDLAEPERDQQGRR